VDVVWFKVATRNLVFEALHYFNYYKRYVVYNAFLQVRKVWRRRLGLGVAPI
jgi:hypothetical protein